MKRWKWLGILICFSAGSASALTVRETINTYQPLYRAKQISLTNYTSLLEDAYEKRRIEAEEAGVEETNYKKNMPTERDLVRFFSSVRPAKGNAFDYSESFAFRKALWFLGGYASTGNSPSATWAYYEPSASALQLLLNLAVTYKLNRDAGSPGSSTDQRYDDVGLFHWLLPTDVLKDDLRLQVSLLSYLTQQMLPMPRSIKVPCGYKGAPDCTDDLVPALPLRNEIASDGIKIILGSLMKALPSSEVITHQIEMSDTTLRTLKDALYRRGHYEPTDKYSNDRFWMDENGNRVEGNILSEQCQEAPTCFYFRGTFYPKRRLDYSALDFNSHLRTWFVKVLDKMIQQGSNLAKRYRAEVKAEDEFIFSFFDSQHPLQNTHELPVKIKNLVRLFAFSDFYYMKGKGQIELIRNTNFDNSTWGWEETYSP